MKNTKEDMKKEKNAKAYAVSSICCSLFSLIVFPLLMGLIAFILAIVSMIKEDNKVLSITALILSIFLPLISIILSFILLMAFLF